MVFDFLEDHKEKLAWYLILSSSMFGFGFIANYLLLNATFNYAFIQGLIWGSSTVFITFIVMMGWKHLK